MSETDAGLVEEPRVLVGSSLLVPHSSSPLTLNGRDQRLRDWQRRLCSAGLCAAPNYRLKPEHNFGNY